MSARTRPFWHFLHRTGVRGALLVWPLLALVGCQACHVPPAELLAVRSRGVSPRHPDFEPAGQKIQLPEALGTAEGENATIALAEEAVRERVIAWNYTKLAWIPTLNLGANFNHHDGALMNASGEVLHVERRSLYDGLGAAAVGGSTVTVPGLRIIGNLSEAILEPQIAQRLVTVQQFQALSVRNSVLLNVVLRYFDLLGAEAGLKALEQSGQDLAEVVKVVDNLFKVGLARKGDADRVRTEQLLVKAQQQRAAEQVAVASAELCRLLGLDPNTRLETPDGLVRLQLFPPDRTLDSLLQEALANHPDVNAAEASLDVQAKRIRQEKLRPWLPTVSVGFSAGSFGGGGDTTEPRFGHFSPRTDFDVVAVWSIANLGLGNRAVQHRELARLAAAEAERQRIINTVREELGGAFAQWQAVHLERQAIQGQLKAAAEAFRLDFIRTRNLQSPPLETLTSLDRLMQARLELVRVIVQDNQAQFRLLVALGITPTDMPWARAKPSLKFDSQAPG